MVQKDLTKVWVASYEQINDHGEKSKKWSFKGIAYLNFQQDLNELDRKSTGETDYSIVNARTDKKYDIKNGNGICLTNIENAEEIKPDFLVTDSPKIGKTTLYKLEKNNGN